MSILSAPLVGMRFHPPAVEVLQELGMDEELVLLREPENPHDENAIKVLLPDGWQAMDPERFQQGGDLFLGYIARDYAAEWAPVFDREGAVPEARLTFGSDGRPQVSIEIEEEDEEDLGHAGEYSGDSNQSIS